MVNVSQYKVPATSAQTQDDWESRVQPPKRKALAAEGTPCKKARLGISPEPTPDNALTTKDEQESRVQAPKRTALAAEGTPCKKARSSISPEPTSEPTTLLSNGSCSSSPSHSTSVASSSSSSSSSCPETESTPVVKTTQDFKSRYIEDRLIGQGGFGVVFTGHRVADNKPVAIKHVPIKKVHYAKLNVAGKVERVILEAALMLAAAAGNPQRPNSAVISLLDCYKSEKEVILVMERPENCITLSRYCDMKGGRLTENEAKIVLQQVVVAATRLHECGVFHRDLKPDNLLVQRDNGLRNIRVIDFGCGEFVEKGPYSFYSGTRRYAPPECLDGFGQHEAEPTTVFQLGMLLTDLLVQTAYSPRLPRLSIACKEFLLICSQEKPELRPTLRHLQLHPWLKNKPLQPPLRRIDRARQKTCL